MVKYLNIENFKKGIMESNKIRGLIFIFAFILLISGISYASAQDELGIFKQNSNVDLLQTCSVCDYVTLDSIKLPNSTTLIINTNMTKDGSTFYYPFYQTDLIGEYIYNTHFGNYTAPVSFEITLSGNPPAGDVTTVVFSILFIVVIFFSIIYLIKIFGHVLQLDVDLMDVAIMVSTYIGLWVFYYITNQYLGNPVLNNLMEVSLDVGAVTHVVIPLVSFMLSFILTNLKFKQKQKYTY